MLNLTEDTITRYVPCALCVFQLLGDQRSAVVKSVYWGALASAGFAMLTKWFSYTRLETRTKESNIYASIWVPNPDAQ